MDISVIIEFYNTNIRFFYRNISEKTGHHIIIILINLYCIYQFHSYLILSMGSQNFKPILLLPNGSCSLAMKERHPIRWTHYNLQVALCISSLGRVKLLVMEYLLNNSCVFCSLTQNWFHTISVVVFKDQVYLPHSTWRYFKMFSIGLASVYANRIN